MENRSCPLKPRPLTGPIAAPRLLAWPRRWALGASIAAAVAAAPWQTASGQITYDINFQGSNLGMWGAGAENNFNYDAYVQQTWDVSIGGGAVTKIPFLGKVGAEFSAASEGTIGLKLSIGSTQGGVDVQSPYRIIITPQADMTSAGVKQIGFSSIINLPTNQNLVTTRFPSAYLDVAGVLDAKATVGGRIYAGILGSVGGKTTLFDFDSTFNILSYNRNGDNNLSVFGFEFGVGDGITQDLTTNTIKKDPAGKTVKDADGLEIKNPLEIRFGSVTLAPPKLDNKSGASFTSTKSQPTLFNAGVDVLGAAAVALGLPLNPFDVGVSAFGFAVQGTIVSEEVGASLGLSQQVTYNPNLHVRLRFGEDVLYNGVPVRMIDVANLSAPISFEKIGDKEIDVIPEFYLATPTLTTKLDLTLSSTVDLKLLELSVSAPALGSLSLGPVLEESYVIPLGSTTIVNRTFSVAESFGGSIIGKGLTNKAPQIVDVSPGQTFRAPGIVGTFATSTIGGALQLSNNSLYANTVPLTISGKLQIVGASNFFSTTALGTSGEGLVELASKSSIEITNNGGWTDMSGSTLTRGNYQINGMFRYLGADIVTNQATLVVNGTGLQNLTGGVHQALGHLAANSGKLTLSTSLDIPNQLDNTGSLSLTGTLRTNRFSNNSGSLQVDFGSLLDANLAANLTNTFLSVNAGGTLLPGTYRIGGQVAYHGADIIRNEADLTLTQAVGQFSAEPYFKNTARVPSDKNALTALSTNANRLTVNGGARLSITSGLNNTLNSTLAVTGGGQFNIAQKLVNSGTVSIDGGTLNVNSTADDAFNSVAGSAFEMKNNAHVTIAGGLNIKSVNSQQDPTRDTLQFGIWNISGDLSYGNGNANVAEIQRLAAGVVVKLTGGRIVKANSGESLPKLEYNDGSLTLEASSKIYLTTDSAFTNRGTLTLSGTSTLFSMQNQLINTGTITVNEHATMQTFGNKPEDSNDIRWTNVNVNGVLNNAGNLIVGGFFRYSGYPILTIAGSSNLTLKGDGKFIVNEVGTINESDALNRVSEIRGGFHLDDSTSYATTNSTLTVFSGASLSIDDSTSSLVVSNGRDLIIKSGALPLVNKGTIYLNPKTTATQLTIDGGTGVLTGGGVISLANNALGSIRGVNGGFLRNVNNKIFGSGSITVPLNNEAGLIESLGSVGLTIGPVTGSQTLVNGGTIRANGAIGYSNPQDLGSKVLIPSPLTIIRTNIANSFSETIEGEPVVRQGLVKVSSILNLTNSTIVGGAVQVDENAVLNLSNSRISAGIVQIRAGGQVLLPSGDSTLAGSVYNMGGGTIRVDTGRTLSLAIPAVPDIPLSPGILYNFGLLRLEPGSTVREGAILNSARIEALTAGSAANLLSPLTNLAPDADAGVEGGYLRIDRGAVLAFGGGTLLNHGTIGIAAGEGNGTLSIASNTAITGSGTLQLGGLSDSSGTAVWQGAAVIDGKSGGAFTLSNGSTVAGDPVHTIFGVGSIGGGTLTLQNNATGLIQANVGGQTMLLRPGAGGFGNQGTVQVDADATLRLEGTLQNLSGNTLTGGTYQIAGRLAIENGIGLSIATNAANIILTGPSSSFEAQGVSLLAGLNTNAAPGRLTLNGNRVLSLPGALANQGTIVLGSATVENVGGMLSVSGLTSTGGAGVVELRDSAGSLVFTGNGAPTTYTGAISGPGGVIKSGTGVQSLLGANSYAGGTVINAGLLTVATLAGNVANNSHFEMASGANSTFAGVISGSGDFLKSGAGTLILSGANSYRGGTTISGGTLQMANAGALGAANDSQLQGAGALVVNGAVLDLNGFNLSAKGLSNASPGGRIISGSPAILQLAPISVANYAGSIEGNIGLVLEFGLANSAQVLAGTNTYTGGTIIRNGLLTFASATALPSTGMVTLEGSGALTMSGPFATANAWLQSGRLTVSGGALALTAASAAQNLDLTAMPNVFIGASMGENVAYSGTLTPGASTYRLGGGGGTLSMINALTGARSLVVAGFGGGGNVILTADSSYTGGTIINPGATLQLGAGSVTGSLGTGLVTDDGMLVFNRSDDLAFSTAISGLGGLIKLGANVLTLLGTSNFKGTTTISSGTLQLGNGGAAGSIGSGPISLKSTMLLNRSGTFLFGSLGGSGVLRNNFGSAVNVSIGGDGGSASFTGNIQGLLALTKTGAGAQSLSGVNTYSGTTTLGGGILGVGNAASLSTGSLIFAGGTLRYEGITTDFSPRFTITAGQSVRVDTNGQNITFGTALPAGGGLVKSGTGKLTLGILNTYTGQTEVAGGTLELTGSGSLYNSGASAGSILVQNGGTLLFSRSDTFGSHTSASPVTLSIEAGGLVTNGNTFNTLQNLQLTGGELRIAGGAVNFPAFQIKGTISTGGGALSRITAVNPALAAQAIQLGNNTAGGVTTFDVSNAVEGTDLLVSAVLTNGRDAVNGLLSVATGLTKTGKGTMALTLANSFTGNVTLLDGTLSVANAGALGSGGSIVFGGGALSYQGIATDFSPRFAVSGGKAISIDTAGLDVTFATALPAAAGGLVKSGLGKLTLSAVNTFGGATVINGGTLEVTTPLYNAGASAGTITVNDGGAFFFNIPSAFGSQETNPQVAFTINEGGVVNSGNHFNTLRNLTLNGGELRVTRVAPNFYFPSFQLKGTVTVGGSTLSEITASQPTLGEQAVVLGNNVAGGFTTFNVADATIGADLRVSASLIDGYAPTGSLPLHVSTGLVKTGAGTMVLAASNKYTGDTFVSAGTLEIAPGGALPFTSSIGVAFGATLALTGSDILGGHTSASGAGVGIEGLMTSSAFNTLANVTIFNKGEVRILDGSSDLFPALQLKGTVLIPDGLSRITAVEAAAPAAAARLAVQLGNNTAGGATTFQTGGQLITNASFVDGRAAASPYLPVASALIKAGPSSMILQGASGYSGGTTVAGGLLRVQNLTALGSGPLTINSGSTVIFNTDLYLNAGLGSNTPLGQAGGAVLSDDGIPGSPHTLMIKPAFAAYTGRIEGTTALTVLAGGPGTFQIMAGNNNYTGLTTVYGLLEAWHANALGSTAGGTVVNSGGMLSLKGRSEPIAFAAEPLTLNGNARLAFNLDDTLRNATWGGPITLPESSNAFIGAGGVNAGTLHMSGPISGPGGLTVFGKTVEFSSAKTYTGQTTVVSGGLLSLVGPNSFSSVSPLVIDTGGEVNASVGQTIASLSGAGKLTLSGAAALSFSIGSAGSNDTFTGVISGLMGLTKIGAGIQLLSGTNSGYTGVTTLSGGTLAMGSSTALGNTGSRIKFNGGMLRYQGIPTDFSSRFDVLNGNPVRIDTNGQTVSFATLLPGGLEKAGAGGLTLPNTAYAAPIKITGGSLTVVGDVMGSANAFTIEPGDEDAILVLNATQTSGRPIITSGTGSGAAIIRTTNGIGGQPVVSVNGQVTLNHRTVFHFDQSDVGRFTFNGKITGNVGTLTIQGRVVLDNLLNDFVGDIELAPDATLQPGLGQVETIPNTSAITLHTGSHLWLTGGISDPGVATETIRALRGSAGIIDALGSKILAINLPAGTETFGGVLNNGNILLSLTKVGAGTQVLTGVSTYTGKTILGGGALGVGNASALGAGLANSITFADGALRYEGIDTDFSSRFEAVASGQAARIDTNGRTVTFAAPITGAGGLEKIGPGTLSLGNANSYAGATTISGGGLIVDGDTFNATSGITINPGSLDAALVFDATQNNNRPITASGSGSGQAIIRATNGIGQSPVIALSGLVTLNRPTTLSLAQGNEARLTFTGKITGNVVTLTIEGRAVLENSANDFLGDIVIAPNALLQAGLAQSETIPNSASITLSAGSRLALTGPGNETIRALRGNAGVVDNLLSQSLQIALPTGTETFGGVLRDGGGPLSLIKSGAGSQVLSGANSYTGTTTINGGTLVVNGSISGSTIVNSGGTLSGKGSVGALSVMNGGLVSPGTSPGTLNSGNFSLASGGQVQFELGGTAEGAYDRLAVTGTVSLAGDARVSLFGGFIPQIGNTFFVIVNDNGADTVNGTFANAVANSLTIPGAIFSINYAANFGGTGIGNDVSLTYVAVPEPSAWLALLGGAALLLGLSRRRALKG